MWRRSSWTTNFSFKGFFFCVFENISFHFGGWYSNPVSLLLHRTAKLIEKNNSKHNKSEQIFYFYTPHLCTVQALDLYSFRCLDQRQTMKTTERERERKKNDVCVYFTKIIKLHTHTEYFNTCAVNDCELHVRYTSTPSHIKCGRPQVESESMNNVFWRSHSPELFSLFCIRLIKTTKQKKAREINTINRKH